MNHKDRRTCGLTLWEVVVILAFLFIVAALILPVLCRPVGATRKGTCYKNLKTLGEAIHRYCSDYDETLPSSMLCRGSKTWNEKDFVKFASKRGDFPSSNGQKTWVSLIHPCLNKDAGIIWCPSDPNRNDQPCAGYAVVSYYWKAAIDRAWYGGYRKIDSFGFPADQILLYEHTGWHWGQSSEGLADGVSINCVFLDGHVASRWIRDSGFADKDSPSPLPKSGVGEPAWFNCNYAAESTKTGKKQLWDPSKYGDSYWAKHSRRMRLSGCKSIGECLAPTIFIRQPIEKRRQAAALQRQSGVSRKSPSPLPSPSRARMHRKLICNFHFKFCN